MWKDFILYSSIKDNSLTHKIIFPLHGFLPYLPLPSFLFYLLCLIGKGQPLGQCPHILILSRHFILQDIRKGNLENNVLGYDCCTNDWLKMSSGRVPVPMPTTGSFSTCIEVIYTPMWWTSISASVLQLFVLFHRLEDCIIDRSKQQKKIIVHTNVCVHVIG